MNTPQRYTHPVSNNLWTSYKPKKQRKNPKFPVSQVTAFFCYKKQHTKQSINCERSSKMKSVLVHRTLVSYQKISKSVNNLKNVS